MLYTAFIGDRKFSLIGITKRSSEGVRNRGYYSSARLILGKGQVAPTRPSLQSPNCASKGPQAETRALPDGGAEPP